MANNSLKSQSIRRKRTQKRALKYFVLISLIIVFSLLSIRFIFTFNYEESASEVTETDITQRDVKWWRNSIIYEIDVRAFRDSDGDGEGDLLGLIEKLDYISLELGINAILLRAFYPSISDRTNARDITDHKGIDARFGTFALWDSLLEHLMKREMRLCVDLMPESTSDEHYWFQNSLDRNSNFSDFYVWSSSSGSHFERTREHWTWNDRRKQFYFHERSTSEPKLNLFDKRVQKEFRNIVHFWTQRGVKGFRIALGSDFRDARETNNFLDLVKQWRRVAGEDVCLILESDLTEGQLFNETVFDLIVNKSLAINSLKITDKNYNSEAIKESVSNSLSRLRNDSAVRTSGYGVGRLASRVGHKLSMAFLMMIALNARVVPIVFFGDEIGLEDNLEAISVARNKLNYEESDYRPVMQWNSNEISGGFSNSTDIAYGLTVSPNYREHNVETELRGNGSSILKFVKKLIEFRNKDQNRCLLEKLSVNSSDVLLMSTRIGCKTDAFLIAVNFNNFLTIAVKTNISGKTGEIVLQNTDLEVEAKARDLSEIEIESQNCLLIVINA